MEPQILFEDQDILVVVKPSGMVVNQSDTTRNMLTLQEWASSKLKVESGELRVDEASEFEKRGGIVHRLDKETSGILVIAKNEESFTKLQAQFKERNVKKVYIALVYGDVKPIEGEINTPIGRLPWNRTHFGVLPEGREAVSKYKVISIFKRDVQVRKSKNKTEEEILSLMEVYPKTGRTHQIRVHAKHLGFPLFADELYAGRKIAKRDRKILPRHFLHATKITFNHPTTGASMEFSSELPPDLQAFLDSLKVNS